MSGTQMIRELSQHMAWADALVWQRVLSSTCARADSLGPFGSPGRIASLGTLRRTRRPLRPCCRSRCAARTIAGRSTVAFVSWARNRPLSTSSRGRGWDARWRRGQNPDFRVTTDGAARMPTLRCRLRRPRPHTSRYIP